MAREKTGRFLWPIPGWDAGWQEWQSIFRDLVNNIDATIFANMEHTKLINKTLPESIIMDVGTPVLRLINPARFVSRTTQTDLVVPTGDYELTANSMIGFSLTPGAVGSSTTEFECFTGSVAVNADIMIVGYVHDDYSITWYNGHTMTVGTQMILFTHHSESDQQRRRAVIDIVDPSIYPPSDVSVGARYILDNGVLDPGWGTEAQALDIVEMGESGWYPARPEEGWIAYVDDRNKDYWYVDDGVPAWEPASAIATASDVSVSTTTFNKNLSAADTDVQLALNTIDDLGIDKLRVSAADTTADYLYDKIGVNIHLSKEITNPAGNEILTLSVSDAGARKEAILAIVDCTAAPPTEVTGDRYVLDETGGTIHADWDGAARKDIVEFDSSSWIAEIPKVGWTTYNEDIGSDYRFITEWTVVTGGGPTIGFESRDRSDSEILYDPTTRIITIQPDPYPGGSFFYYNQGIRYEVTEPVSTTPHENFYGQYYMYWDSDNVLQGGIGTPQADDLTDVRIATVVYNLALVDGFAADTRHHYLADKDAQHEFRWTVGTYWYEDGGLDIADYTLDPAVPVDADNQLSIDPGFVQNGDIKAIITGRTSGEYRMVDRLGLGGAFFWEDNSVPFLVGTTYPYWNENVAGTWQYTELTDDQYVNMFALVIPTSAQDSDYDIMFALGQQVHDTFAEAQGESVGSLDFGDIEFPIILGIYKITFHTDATFTNLGKCNIVAVKDDRRIPSRQASAVPTPGSHNSLPGLQGGQPVPDEYYHLTLADHTAVPLNTADRHAELHTIASHSDTSATGPELDELVAGLDTALHLHANSIHVDTSSEFAAIAVTRNTPDELDLLVAEDGSTGVKVKIPVGRLPGDKLQFNTNSYTPSSEPEGQLWWNATDHTINSAVDLDPDALYTAGTRQSVLQAGQESLTPIFNDSSTSVVSEDTGMTGDGRAGSYDFSLANTWIWRGSVEITANTVVFTDPASDGVLLGTGAGGGYGTVDYATGAISFTMNTPGDFTSGNALATYDYGTNIPNGAAVYYVGLHNGTLTVELAKADVFTTVRSVRIATMDVPPGEYGFLTERGKVRGVSTIGIPAGPPLYVSATVAGGWTYTRPEFPNYDILIGAATTGFSADGTIHVALGSDITDTFDNFWNGTIRETFDFTISASDPNITGLLEQTGGGDLTMMFSDGFTTLDCTTVPLTVALSAGADDNPQMNYVFIRKVLKTLDANTSWPVDEHIKIATILCKSALTTETEDALRNQNWNDHIQGTDNQGHLSHVTERVRSLDARWDSGADGAMTLPTATEVYASITSGQIYQMHRQTIPALDMQTGALAQIVNHATTKYLSSSNLATQMVDALGGDLTNGSFSFVLWGVANKTGETSHLMINLPIGKYSRLSPDLAVSDSLNYSVYDIPKLFQGVGFLIGRYTFTLTTGGDWALYDSQPLLGFTPNTTAGGGGGGTGVTTFTGLTDTPATYVGQAGKVATVNGGEDALEFVDPPSAYPEDNIIVVQHGATDIENGTNLLTAYNVTAPGLVPAPSEFNRVLIIVPAGNYDIQGSTLTLNNNFIDLIGHGTCRNHGVDEAGPFSYPATRIIGTATDLIQATNQTFLFKGFHLHQSTSGNNHIRIESGTGCNEGQFIDIGLTQTGTYGNGIWAGTVNHIMAAYFEQVHTPLGKIGYMPYSPAEFSGKCVDCTAYDFSYGSATGNSVTSGWFERCYGYEKCFGYTTSGTQEFSGYAKDCRADSWAFAATDNTGLVTFSGTAINCEVRTLGFAVNIGSGYNSEFSGRAESCKVTANYGFGCAGVVTSAAVLIGCEFAGVYGFGQKNFNGYAKDCVIDGADSLPNGTGAAASTGTLEDCRILSRTQAISEWNGIMRRCVIESTVDGVELLGDDSKFDGCSFQVGAASDSITGAYNTVVVGCKMNRDIDSGTTNLIENGYNVVDSDFAI